ncbi:MAG: SRPBCC domain-containing protein [Aestuariivirga sp.]
MTETHSLKVSAIIKAPRPVVYAAWTTAETLRKWFAPGDRKPDPAILDVRPGGKYRIIMVGQEDSPAAVGEYREVVPGEKLVFTWGWDGDPSQPTLVTVTFKDVKDGTEVTLLHERFTTAETCEHHRMGWQAIMDKLPALFTV